ncbi:hypothetical protein N7486_009240 [Penicillium sp. IBT 16267x]|nr:hypothetical protein N7486_009240 [Penicillium sp. IBT 16267x]
MAYRGQLQDGHMFAMKGTAITIEGTEQAASKATPTETELTQTPPTTRTSEFSDGMVTGDWVLPVRKAGSGLSSWEFIGPE